MLGEIYYEKIQRFLRVFFQKNLYLQTNHQYTIVLFARLFYPQFENINDLYKKLVFVLIKVINISLNLKKSWKLALKVIVLLLHIKLIKMELYIKMCIDR